MIVATAHAPTYLPGLSVIRKIAEADVVLWLDEVRYTTPGYLDRNELPDGTWLTVPVRRDDHRTLLRDVRIVGDGWQQGHLAALDRLYGECEHYDPALVALISSREWADERLVDLNQLLNTRILGLLELGPKQVLQSDYRLGGRSISERLVRTVKALGADVYLSGPGGWRYLDPARFSAEGIELRYHSHVGPNPCIVDPLFRTGALEPVVVGEIS